MPILLARVIGENILIHVIVKRRNCTMTISFFRYLFGRTYWKFLYATPCIKPGAQLLAQFKKKETNFHLFVLFV
uniref:Uncharacterized protein n=1 Tax=Anopheles atroparvus TaxID=41427 RepID=A0AAG5D6L8_ANOAO